MAALNWTPPPPPRSLGNFRNNADYAADVHLGDVVRPDGTSTPARPYMDVAVQEADVPALFKQHFGFSHDLDKALRSTCEDLHQAMLDNILSDRWDWDRETVRSDGETVDSPRNIYDTGNLYDLQELVFSAADTEIDE